MNEKSTKSKEELIPKERRMDSDRVYHVSLTMERAAILALLETAPDEVSEYNIDLLTMEQIAPLRAALRKFIAEAVAAGTAEAR